MDLQQVGTHSGVGILSAIATFFGFKQRMDRQDEEIKQLKQDMVKSKECDLCKDKTDVRFEALHESLSEVKSGQKEMNNKLDKIMDKL